VVVVNPGILLGAGDRHLTSTGILLRCLQAPVTFYPQGGGSLADVRDVADAVVCALVHGRAGARYLLGGVNVTYRELLATLARLGGRPAPVPWPPLAAGLWSAASELASRWGPHPLDAYTTATARFLDRFNFCDSTRAHRELRYRASSLEVLLRDTLADFLRRGVFRPDTAALRKVVDASASGRTRRRR
jgi:dihydroflavonol-4-reductase